MRTADFIVRSLEAHGIRRVYCVPGESFLTLLDALYGSNIQVVVCRHEGGAGFMAVAEAKLTGLPGVVLASRGPGATNAAIAVHTAEQDAVPLLLLLGQVSREERLRGAFQEVDYSHMFGTLAKGVYEINEGRKAVELVPRALRLAQAGVKGPVVLSLPEDMLGDELDAPEVRVYPVPAVQHTSAQAAVIQQLIDGSERPVLVAGSQMRGPAGAAALQKFAEAQRVPVAVTWKNQDVFDNASPLYAGHLGFGNPAAHQKLLAEADLVLAFGTRLGDIATLGYAFPQAPFPQQTLVHVYADSAPLGRVFQTAYPIVADPAGLLAELASTARVVNSQREQWISRLGGYIAEFATFKPRNPDDGVDFGEVVMALAAQAPADCIVATDAGNMSSWVHRHWKLGPRNTMLGGIAGAMGLGVPAAVAASLAAPARMSIAFVGDGGILMTGQEIATAIGHGGKPKIVLSDNGIYGTIRTHQEREFPGRVSGTTLVNPDFSAWAASFGIGTYTLSRGMDVAGVVARFLADPGAALLHVKSSRFSLSAYGVMPATAG